jgi:enoyl-CoA hydratase/carnithine racemase
MYAALSAALDQARASQDVRVALIDAEGADFCAGNDIADFLAAAQGQHDLRQLPAVRFLHALVDFDRPLVAAVRGRAVGIGTTLLLHCDLAYLAEDARLSVPFVDLALVPEAASSVLLPARLGHARAFAMFALGETLDGRSAVACGLGNAALAAAEVSAHARAAAIALAGKNLPSLVATKRLMREPEKLHALIDAEARVFAERMQSADAKAVFQSFLARRTARPAAS